MIPAPLPSWLLLALLAALFSAAAETLRKRLMRDVGAHVAAFLTAGVAALGLLPLALHAGLRNPDPSFWLAAVVSGGINAVAAVLVARSYMLSDLSLVSPLTGTTPVFTLAVAAVVLGELPTAAGVAGVGAVVVGTWVLAVGRGRGPGEHILAPLRALWDDRGARLMLLVAFLYGTSSTFDKMGVLASNPLQWSVFLQGAIALATGARVVRSPERTAQLRGMGRIPWLLVAGTGLATAAMMWAQMTALTVGLAGYVIAVKRVSILLTVVAGGLLFRERHTAVRLTGSAVIIGGLVLLALA